MRLRRTVIVSWSLWLCMGLGLAGAVAAGDEPALIESTSGPLPLSGQPAPPLPWIDVIGVEGASAEARVETLRQMTAGKVILIDFWATWCGFCIQSMPHGLELARQDTSGSLVVIFATHIDPQNTRAEVDAFVEHGYKDRHGVEFDGIVALLDDHDAYRKWQRGGIPRYAVVDQRGIVRYEGTGAGAAVPAGRAAEALIADVDVGVKVVDEGSNTPVDAQAGATVEQRLADAERAIDEGRLDDAESQYRAILVQEPGNDYVYELLWQLSRGRTLAMTSKPYERTRRLLPGRFEVRETSHFVIFSDADSTWVRRQGEVLERTYDQFIRFALGLGLRPLPVAHKLVAIAFENRRDFYAYAGKDGVPSPALVAGYYSRTEDHLVFYHAESSANIAQGRRQLEEMLAEIDAIKRASRRARLIGRQDDAREIAEGLDERLDDVADHEYRLNVLARQRTISVTVHEAVHQLMFHTRVQAPAAHQPRWLSEGLAVAFETDAHKSPFGPTHEYEPRRRAFWQLLDNDGLLPLRDLLTSGHTTSAQYAQSHALVAWMCRHRRRELREYMQHLNTSPPGPVTREGDLEVFEASFGDIDQVERRWLRYERAAD